MTQESWLGRDVKMLGACLGRVLTEQVGTETFTLVEEVRHLAKAHRKGDGEAGRKLRELLDQVDWTQGRQLIRAFTMLLDLMNAAEDRQRVRVLREREAQQPDQPRGGSIADAVAQLKDAVGGIDSLHDAVERLDIELVLTAHPTEAKRRTVRSQLRRIRDRLAELDRTDLLPREREALTRSIEADLTVLWHTDLAKNDPPSVAEEVERGLLVAKELWEVTPRLYRDMNAALDQQADAWEPPAFLRFGSWIGGDRDGHPGVTPQVTQDTLGRHRAAALALHIESCRELSRLLSIATTRIPSAKLDQLVEQRLKDMPACAPLVERFTPSEGYRRFLNTIRYQLEAARSGEGGYRNDLQLLDDLVILRDSMVEAGLGRLAHEDLEDWIIRTRVFGFHLLRLDVRQDGRVYREIVRDLYDADYLSRSESEKQAVLLGKLDASGAAPQADLARQTGELFDLIAQTLDRSRGRALGGHVISMTQAPSDVLMVLRMLQDAEKRLAPNEPLPPLPIVPLFETIGDLEAGPDVLETLFTNEHYLEHLKRCSGKQIIMVGYSDSTKDGGYLTACWALYRGQARMHAVAEKHGIQLVVFHGRGGSLGRGGGPAARSIASLPAHTVDGAIRITEQGEVLADRYDDPDIAYRHLEQVVSATLLTELQGEAPTPDAWVQMMDRVSQASLTAYRQLVELPAFIDYFRQATPIGEIERLQIGSRPSRRRSGASIADLRAIPWVFSWTQNRHLLPAWYGLGQALQQEIDRDGGLDALQLAYRDWPFFRATLDNAALAVAKFDHSLAECYAELATGDATAVWDRIEQGWRESREAITSVIGIEQLLDDIPWLKRSIVHRNPYVEPLNLLQVRLLKELGQDGDNQELRDLARLSIYGVAAGLRTTG